MAATLALSFLLLAAPAAADHEPPPGPGPTPLPNAKAPWDGGFYYLLDFAMGDARNPDTGADFGVDLDWAVGVGFGAGYRVGPLRLEGEINTEFFRVGSLDLGAASPFPANDYAGAMRTLNGMANLYVDLPAAGQARPYIGAGLGVARVSAEYNESVCFIFCFSTKNEVVDDWDMVPAWQAMAGVSFATFGSNSEWFVGYRYYETGDLDFRTVSGVPFRQDGLRDHSLMAGIRFLVN